MTHIDETAEAIYVHFYGHLDDKEFRAGKVSEITDWLKEGDAVSDAQIRPMLRPTEALTLRTLIDEWGAYDEEEVNRQDPDYIHCDQDGNEYIHCDQDGNEYIPAGRAQ